MGTTQAAHSQLFFEIEQLSGRYLAELESFVQYLKFKQADARNRALPKDADPLLAVLGGMNVQPFADDVDDTLYAVL